MTMCDNENKADKVQDFHFYASSCGAWMVDEDIHKLISRMDSDGMGYNLFYVPTPISANYEIRFYQPQVEGSLWLGYKSTTDLL